MKRLIFVLVLLSSSFNYVQADDSAWGVIKGTAGVLLGTPVSFFTGIARGATRKSIDFTEAIQDGFGRETTFSKIVSYPLGFVSGGLIGGAAGAVKGVTNGIYYGVKEPFSEENFTVEGDFVDFEPFDYSSAEYGTI